MLLKLSEGQLQIENEFEEEGGGNWEKFVRTPIECSKLYYLKLL